MRPVHFLLAALAILALVTLASCTETGDDASTTAAPPQTAGTDENASSTSEAGEPTATTGAPGDGSGGTSVETLPDGPADPAEALGVVTQSDRLAPEQGPFSSCPDCHAYLDPPGEPGRTLKGNFGHEPHIERGADCISCHQRPTHTEQGIRYPTMVKCFGCHGDEADAVASGECVLCHPADFDLVPASHTQAFVEEGGHPKVAEEEGRDYCVLCHEGSEEDVCDTCHGIALPHPADFLPSAGDLGQHVARAHEEPDVCTRCHDLRTDTPAACYSAECHGT